MAIFLSSDDIEAADQLWIDLPRPKPTREQVYVAVAENGGIERYRRLGPEQARVAILAWIAWREKH